MDRLSRLLAASLVLTSLACAAEGGVDSVFLITSVNYPDSVAAAATANKLGAPVVVTGEDRLGDEVVSALRELAPRTVYIIGGPAVISDDVESQLGELGFATVRIWEMSQFGTAAGIAIYFWTATGARTAVLACDNIYAVGEDYKQLAASLSLARLYGAPILLTECDALSVYAASTIRSLNVSQVVLVATNPSENLTSAVESLGATVTPVTGSTIDKTLERIVAHIKGRLSELKGIKAARIVITEDRFEDILKVPNDPEDTVVFVVSDTSKAKELVDFVKSYDIERVVVTGDSELADELVKRIKEQNITEEVNVTSVTEADPVASAAERAVEAKAQYAERAQALAARIGDLERQLEALQLAKKATDEVARAEVTVGEMRVLVANHKDDPTLEEGALAKALEFVERGSATLGRAQDALEKGDHVAAFRHARQAQDEAAQAEWAVISTMDNDRRAARIQQLVSTERKDVRSELEDAQALVIALEERVESYEREFGEDARMRYILKAAQRLARDAEFAALDTRDIDAFRNAVEDIKRKSDEVDKLISRAQLGGESEVTTEVEGRQFDSAVASLEQEFGAARGEDVDLGDLGDLLGALKQAGSASRGWDQVLDLREKLDRKKNAQRAQSELDSGRRYIEGLADRLQTLKGAGYDVRTDEAIVEELGKIIEEGQRLINEGKLSEVDRLAEQAKRLVARLEASIGIAELSLELAAYDESLDAADQGADAVRLRIEVARMLEALKGLQQEISDAEGTGETAPIIDVRDRVEGLAQRARHFMAGQGGGGEPASFEDELGHAYDQLDEGRARLGEMEAMGVDTGEVSYLVDVAEEHLFNAYSSAASGDMDAARRELGEAWKVIEEGQVRGQLIGVSRHLEEVTWQMEEMEANGIDLGPAGTIASDIEGLVAEAKASLDAGDVKAAGRRLSAIEKRFGGLHRALDGMAMYFEFMREQERVRSELEDLRYRAAGMPPEAAGQLESLVGEIESGIAEAIELAKKGESRAAERSFRSSMEMMPLAHFFMERAMVEEGLAQMRDALYDMEQQGFDTSAMETKVKDAALCFDTALEQMRAVRGPQDFDRLMGKCRSRMDRLRQEFDGFMRWREFNGRIEDSRRFLDEIDMRMSDFADQGFEVPSFIKDLKKGYEETLRAIEGLAKQGDYKRAERLFEKLQSIREQIDVSGAFIDIERRLADLERRMDEAEGDPNQQVDTRATREDVAALRKELDTLRRSGLSGDRLRRSIDRFHQRVNVIERGFESGRWLGGLRGRLDNLEGQLADDEANGLRVDELYEDLADLRAELRSAAREVGQMREGQRWDLVLQRFERRIQEFEKKRAVSSIPYQLSERIRSLRERVDDMGSQGMDARAAQAAVKGLEAELGQFNEKLKTLSGDRLWREQERFNQRINEVEQGIESQRMAGEFQRRFDELEDQLERMKENGADVSRPSAQLGELRRRFEEMRSKLATSRDPGRLMDSFRKELDSFQQGLGSQERLSGLENEIRSFEEQIDDMESKDIPDLEILRRIVAGMRARADELRKEVQDSRDPGRAIQRFDNEWERMRFEFWRSQWLLWKANDLANMRREASNHDGSALREFESYYEGMRRQAATVDQRGWDRFVRDYDKRANELADRYWRSGQGGQQPGPGPGGVPPQPPMEDKCGTCRWVCLYKQGLSQGECDGACAPACGGSGGSTGGHWCPEGKCWKEGEGCVECGGGSTTAVPNAPPRPSDPCGSCKWDCEFAWRKGYEECKQACQQPCGGGTSTGGQCPSGSCWTGSGCGPCGPAPSQGTSGFCGDGRCDPNENSNVCCGDCGGCQGPAGSSPCQPPQCTRPDGTCGPCDAGGQKCPDGVCDEYEKANPGACCQDCGGCQPPA